MCLAIFGIYLYLEVAFIVNVFLKFRSNWTSVFFWQPYQGSYSGQVITGSLDKGRLTSSHRGGGAAASSKGGSAEFPGTRCSASLASVHVCPSQILFIFLRFYFFFDRVRDSKRQNTSRQGEWEREKQASCPAKSPMQGSIPGPWDSNLSQRQTFNN